MTTSILQHNEDPILRETATPVEADEFGTPDLLQTVTQLQNALHTTHDGIAIAAPQIGISKRMFLVHGKAYDHTNDPNGYNSTQSQKNPDKIFINPVIIKYSKKINELEEGCLSVKNYFGMTPRHTHVTVQAYNENGEEFTEGRSGLLAQIFQHEIDHLDGILFIDKAKNIERRDPDSHNNDQTK